MKIQYSFTSCYSWKTNCYTLWRLGWKNCWTFDGCVVWWCSDGPINSQECKSFEIYAVTIKIFMTEYHHWINGQAHLFQHSSLRGRNEEDISGHIVYFHFFEALNGAFELQFFFRASFLHLIKDTDTDSMKGTCSSDFFRVIILLNNAFSFRIRLNIILPSGNPFKHLIPQAWMIANRSMESIVPSIVIDGGQTVVCGCGGQWKAWNAKARPWHWQLYRPPTTSGHDVGLSLLWNACWGSGALFIRASTV